MATSYMTGGGLAGGSATVTFSSAAPQTHVDSDIVVEWDFDGDGDFGESIENITSYVITLETLAGRDFPSSLTGEVGPGQLKLTLLNTDGRFSFFNASSPLNTDPFSLRTGRKIRVRTAESTPDDPVLFARDRFNRADGGIGATETGQTWTARQGFFFVRGKVAAAADNVFSTRILQTIDVGTPNHYVQGTLRQVEPTVSRFVGFVVRWLDMNNYTLVRYIPDETTPLISIQDTDAGVDTVLDTYALRGWEGMTLGAGVSGTTVTAYVGGVPVASGTTANATGNHCGLYSFYVDNTGRSPEIGDFYVWDKVPAPVDGIIWTGTVLDVTPGVTVGSTPLAEVTAEGILTNAARTKIASPRLPLAGAPTGLIVGEVLSRAGLLHPPGAIQEGTVTTGSIGVEDGEALALARDLEETERGFLHETNEGYVAFHDREARTLAASNAWFTDTPGQGQYPYSSIVPVDHKGQIINEVVAGVAPDAPSGISVTTVSGTGDVDITLPTVADEDLLIIFIANSENSAGELWLNPIWWVNHRDIGSEYGMRIYSHIASASDTGTTVIFYNNAGGSLGHWVAQIYRIQDWYENYNQGIAMGELVRGGNPGPLVHGWGREPTLFLFVRVGLGASPSTMGFSSAFNPPDGYGTPSGQANSNGTIGLDVGIMSSYKVDCTESEDPTEFAGLTNAITDESVLMAIRGYNGEHTKPTLDDPTTWRTTGGDGRFVTRRDLDSQQEHNAVRTHEAPTLFRSEADAELYADGVLSEFADDRPILSLSFWASSSAELRGHAVSRRVGDKITVTATGDTNLGVERDFFIESINHRWANGGKTWDCTWELSPA